MIYRLFFFISLVIISTCSFSQQVILTTINFHPDVHVIPAPSLEPGKLGVLQNKYDGRVMQQSINQDYSGSPYLFDDWQSGTIVTLSATFENVKMQFDILHNKFYFNRNDSIFEFPDDVLEIRIKNAEQNNEVYNFRRVINGNGILKEGSFVQLLCDGKVLLFKQFIKRIEGENQTNGIFTSEKKVVSDSRLWALHYTGLVPVKLNKQSLEELTSDKSTQVQNFIKQKKLNPKSEKDFIEVIKFYNDLKEEKEK